MAKGKSGPESSGLWQGMGVGACQGSFVALTQAQQTPPGSQAESLCQGAFVPGPDAASLGFELQSWPWVLTAELRGVSASWNPPNVREHSGEAWGQKKMIFPPK